MSNQNVFGPAATPIFSPPPVRPVQKVRLALEEMLWSWPGVVAGTRQSGLWVPPFDTLVAQVIISQRVAGTVTVTLVSSVGVISSQTVSSMVSIQRFPVSPTIPGGGWVRADVTASGGCQDLVISIRHARSALGSGPPES